ncbi:uncharacterized protein LOC130905533 isoform X2 [Corythoichthys intestinalis]|uniref:uncharacterized protein LOC130905533 isoform X2 n=1 Tax=Corythoichthys intestinalis TaxID=161448 RepID=UPI0025A5CB3E|nr:uncharacterized protein LOC130905533 isoform X2 [Corythoichthys intestinalis]
MNEQTPSPVYHLTVALFGKRMLSNNHIGKLILANDDVFRKISKDFGVGENHSFKVINVPNFFEDCPAPDQQIWGAARPSFLYDYKDHSWRVIERRMEQLKMTRSSEVETKTRPGPTKLAGRGNRIGQTPQLIASSDATDIDNASRGGSITPKEHFPHPRRAAYPRSGVNNARK